MAGESLLPCPWCGKTVSVVDYSGPHHSNFAAVCCTCGINGREADTAAEAAAAWNHRADAGWVAK